MKNDLLFQLALTFVPNIGPVQAKLLLQHLEPADIFRAKKTTLEKIEGIGAVRASCIKKFNDFSAAETELAFIEKYGITPLFYNSTRYPKRLLNCYDPPTMLYYKGEADLNASRVVAVIGTRNNTAYGKTVTEKLIHDLGMQGATVVSGLAYGVDALAHRAALNNQLPTIGVLAHGLDQIYPSDHHQLARDMVKQGGGLLTEFRSGTKPGKHNFPSRNRIVAGMCDATIVVETGLKGGSMITAELANGYNRDVFAIPGKATDQKSTGCNYLVRTNKAVLLTDAQEIGELLGWQEAKKPVIQPQKELFIELSTDEKAIIRVLHEEEITNIDAINLRSGLASSMVVSTLLSMELRHIIVSLPGQNYRIA